MTWRLVRRHARVRWPAPWLLGLVAAVALMFVLQLERPIALTVPTLRATLETCLTLFGIATALLVGAHAVRTGRWRALLLLAALLILTTTEFVADALPAALNSHSHSGFTAILPFGQLIGAALLVATALTPSEKLIKGHHRPIACVVLFSVCALGFAELAGWVLRHELLAAPASSGVGADAAVRHPLDFAVLLLTVAVFALAAIEFDRRGRLEKSHLLSLLGGAALLLGAARLYCLALPAVSPEVVTLREVMRLAAFALIFVLVLRRELEGHSSMARAAAISERHRVAEDLHDGLAQDLTLIAAHGARMEEELGAEHPVVVAARRALAVSRGTIGELSDMNSASVQEALEVVAHELRSRFAIAVTVDVQLEHDLPPATRRHVARIVREAIANAARHGHATHVIVTLKRTGAGLTLRVADNGCGISDARGAIPAEGFGLRSMRDRATALSGSFAARSGRAGGTEVEVVFPGCVWPSC